MSRVRLGAVEYLNARPLVYGLDQSLRFDLRFDLPSRCAALLHGGELDLGLIPSIEYARQPRGGPRYAIVPDLAIASRGPVASVALYTTRPMSDVRSIALDTASRTSVALVRVLCSMVFQIQPLLQTRGPDLAGMLADSDAALIIGDNALLLDGGELTIRTLGGTERRVEVVKVDLGELWTQTTGLPFVYAFWAGRAGAITAEDVAALQHARADGLMHVDVIARDYFMSSPEHRPLGARYLRDNIKYSMGPEEHAGLELFYRYAVESSVLDRVEPLRFF